MLREFDVEKYERSLREEGKSQGLAALIRTLKPMLNDIDKVYEVIMGDEAYADVIRETVQEYYHTTQLTNPSIMPIYSIIINITE